MFYNLTKRKIKLKAIYSTLISKSVRGNCMYEYYCLLVFIFKQWTLTNLLLVYNCMVLDSYKTKPRCYSNSIALNKSNKFVY